MIELISVNISHAEVLMKWRVQPSGVRHNPVKNLTIEELIKSIESKCTDLSYLVDGASFGWIGLTDKGEPFGQVTLNFVNTRMGTAEIGYLVGEQFQGKGWGTKLVKQAVEMIFEKTPLRKLCAHVHDKNIPSCKLLERIGFKKEGLLREHYLINGQPEHEVFYGRLRNEA